MKRERTTAYNGDWVWEIGKPDVIGGRGRVRFLPASLRSWDMGCIRESFTIRGHGKMMSGLVRNWPNATSRSAAIRLRRCLRQKHMEREAARGLAPLLPLLEGALGNRKALGSLALRKAIALAPLFQAVGYVRRSRRQFRHNP